MIYLVVRHKADTRVMRNVNVLQHQYAISSEKLGIRKLSTKGIWICTGFYGWDKKNKVAFLCHFDHPKSADAISEILNKIKSQVPEEHHFESYLIGGKSWFWSRFTRNRINGLVENQKELNISINALPFKNLPFSSVNVTICSKTGQVSHEKLAGSPAPKGGVWFFKPLVYV
jgi:hypothetical protein